MLDNFHFITFILACCSDVTICAVLLFITAAFQKSFSLVYLLGDRKSPEPT